MSLETNTEGHIQVESVSVEEYAQYLAQVHSVTQGVVEGETVTLVHAAGEPDSQQTVLVTQHDGTTDLSQAIEAVTASNPNATVYVTHQALEGSDADAQYARAMGLPPGTVLVAHTAADLGAMEGLDTETLTALHPTGLFLTQAAQPEPPIAVSSQIKKPVGKGPYTCEICSKVFNKWNQLQRHMKSHDEDKPFRCNHCSTSFNMEDNLRLHLATHVGENEDPTCPECGKKFSRIASLKAHIMLHEKEESLMCPECGDEFSLQSQLDRHMREHREEQEGTRTYPCRQCTQEFTRLALLRDHMKQHYRIKSSLHHRSYKRNVDRSGFSHKCPICGKTFQKPSQLERHNRIHTGERPFKCSVCEKAFNQKGSLQIHMTKHTGERPYICDFCDAAFSQRGNLRAHIKRVHPMVSEKDPGTLYRCEECTCVFRKLGSLNAHFSRMHVEPTELPTQVEMRRVADPGKQVTDVIEQLLQLSGTNENEDPATNQPMEGDEAHSQQLSQVGDVAEKARQASDILQQALENSGLTNTSATSSTSTVINSAIASIAGDGGIQSVVGVTSTLQVHDAATGTVKRHVIRKVNGIRWHQCTYCSKEFKKPSDLVRHIRIHTHEKPYKCTQCFRAFAVKSTLTAHIKTHTGVKEFRCPVCDKHFSTQGSLKVHLRLHTGAKPFDCSHCDKKFRTSAHLKSHVASHFKGVVPVTRQLRRSFRRAAKPDVAIPDIPLQEPILITDTGLIQQPSRNTMFQQYLGESSSMDRPYKCGYCQRSFKKSSHLKQHIRSHTGEKPYKCLSCLKSFVSNGVLKAHIRTHTGTKAYKCLICDCTFTTNGSLKRHMSTHSEVRPFMCPYCQKTFKTSVNCKKHMKTHRQELAMQAIQEGRDPQVELGDEREGEELEPTTTTTLPTDMGQPSILQEALNQTLDQQLTLTSQVFSQQPISQQNLAQQNLTSQNLGQQNLGQQNLGQQSFTQSLLQFNSFNPNQFTVQDSQPQQTIDINSLTSSLSQPTSVSDNNTNVVTSLASTSMQNILQTREPEYSQYSAASPEPNQTEADDGKRTFRCGYCQKAFKKSSHLKQHIRSHTGEKPFKCTTCKRRFVSTGVLKAHLKTHTGVKDYKCSVCNTQFTTNGSLTRHMAMHTSLHPFKCPYCIETFRTAVHCKRHLRTHREAGGSDDGDEEGRNRPRWSRSLSVIQITEEEAEALSKNPEENISVSEKILIESASEKNRISEVRTTEEFPTSNEPKYPHECCHCAKSFKKPSDLIRHVRIHTGEKPYCCDLCGRSFTVKSTLDSHMKTHGAGDKNYKCHVCSSMFSTKGSLKVHMRLHTGAKPFKCPHCDQRFRTSGHRKSHIVSHLKEDVPKKRRVSPRMSNVPTVNLLDESEQQILTSVNSGVALNQVINVDQSQLQQAQQQPTMLPVTLNEGGTSLNESALAAHVLQGLEGIQLHFTSNLGQGVQISALDPSLLQQTVQIDGNLLQQLQQQGNINITINPNLISQHIPEQNLLQNVQIQPVSVVENINPNVIVQPMSAIVLPGLENQQTVVSQSAAELANSLHLEPGQEATFLVAADGSEAQQVRLEQTDVAQTPSLSLLETDPQPAQEVGSDEEGTSQPNENLTHEDSANVSLGSTAAPEGDRTHVCLMCQKAFKRASHLKEHLITHVPANTLRRVRATPHVCPTCNKSFQKPSQLERHMRIHTGERPFVCEICHRAFNQKNALIIHLKKHSGDKPHKCSYCELAFTQKGNLKTHIKRAHHIDMVLSMNIPASSASNVPQPATTISVISDNGQEEEETAAEVEEETALEPNAPDDSATQDETLDLEITELFQ